MSHQALPNRRLGNLLFYLAFLLMFGAGILGILKLGSHLHERDTQPPATAQTASPLSPAPQTVKAPGPAGLRDDLTALVGSLHNPLSILLLQLVVIMLAARGMGKLFRRIGQPSVIGEVVAGILLGPSLLGLISPKAQAFLFPTSSMATLQLLSQIGVILFMFIVGIELDLGHLREKGTAAVLVSHASIIVPFFLGTTLSLYIFPILAPPGIPFSAFALFMGVAMSITAFPVLARVVNERGLARSPLGTMALACAAVDDATAWCLLAIVVAIVKASGLRSAALTISLVILFVIVMLFLARPQTERLFASGEARVGRVAGILAFAFASALFTETIGIHPLFGAFLAGVVMPSGAAIRTFVRTRLETTTSVVLLPLFFASTGLRTQLGLLNDWQSVYLCAGIIAVAIAGKFGGSAIAARWTGMSWHDALSIGALMNTRGLVELIALNIGFDLGILSPRIFTMMVIMALLTTFMAGPVLAFLEWITGRDGVKAFQRTKPEVTGT